MHHFVSGAPAGSAPSFCPRCSARIELTAQGTVAPHNTRVAGPSCDGAGLPAAILPPWPGTIKPSPRTKQLRIRRLSRTARKAALR